MFESEATLHRLNRTYLDRLMADYPESELDVQPHPGLHSCRWILAHLAIVSEGCLKQLGQPTESPAAWFAAYGPATAAGSHSTIRPSREALLAAIEKGYDRLIAAAKSAPAEVLAAPHGIERLNWTGLVTRGELISHALATHFALHVGQLSTLRRLRGFDPLF